MDVGREIFFFAKSSHLWSPDLGGVLVRIDPDLDSINEYCYDGGLCILCLLNANLKVQENNSTQH